MDRTTNIRKGTFMRLAKYLTPTQINNLRSLSPRLKDWGFEYLVRNNLFDLDKINESSRNDDSDSAWSLIIESKLEFFRLHKQREPDFLPQK